MFFKEVLCFGVIDVTRLDEDEEEDDEDDEEEDKEDDDEEDVVFCSDNGSLFGDPLPFCNGFVS